MDYRLGERVGKDGCIKELRPTSRNKAKSVWRRGRPRRRRGGAISWDL